MIITWGAEQREKKTKLHTFWHKIGSCWARELIDRLPAQFPVKKNQSPVETGQIGPALITRASFLLNFVFLSSKLVRIMIFGFSGQKFPVFWQKIVKILVFSSPNYDIWLCKVKNF